MSCCKPGYREIVNKKEEEINQNGQDSIPFYVKIVAILITGGGLLAVFGLY